MYLTIGFIVTSLLLSCNGMIHNFTKMQICTDNKGEIREKYMKKKNILQSLKFSNKPHWKA